VRRWRPLLAAPGEKLALALLCVSAWKGEVVMSTYPVMLIAYHAGIEPAGAWSYTADRPPEPGDEIVITQASGLPYRNAVTVHVKSVLHGPPFAITATMLA
jgi:hypothetical protein